MMREEAVVGSVSSAILIRVQSLDLTDTHLIYNLDAIPKSRRDREWSDWEVAEIQTQSYLNGESIPKSRGSGVHTEDTEERPQSPRRKPWNISASSVIGFQPSVNSV
jgi:hypothetical protein